MTILALLSGLGIVSTLGAVGMIDGIAHNWLWWGFIASTGAWVCFGVGKWLLEALRALKRAFLKLLVPVSLGISTAAVWLWMVRP